MSDYKEYLTALGDSFKELEKATIFKEYSEFQKKHSEFLMFFAKNFTDDNPEYEEILEDLSKQLSEKRKNLSDFFTEQIKHIPGLLTDEGKLSDDCKSFFFRQIDNHLMVKPPKPLVPNEEQISEFYLPIYQEAQKNNKQKEQEKEKMTETTLNLSAVQIQACALAGLNLKDFEGKDTDIIKAAWEEKGFIVENDSVFYKDGHIQVDRDIIKKSVREMLASLHPDKHIEEEDYYKSLFQMVNASKNKSLPKDLGLENKLSEKKYLIIRPAGELAKLNDNLHEEQKPETETDLHWIDKKIADYTAMQQAGNNDIKKFVGDKTAGTFTAEVDNGTITYTSENEASVTQGSSYKVFDTMMKEPSNAGKAVRIPAEASPEFKTNLFVAAVLNGHTATGIEGLELDAETLNKIGLNEEQKAKVLAALTKLEEKPAEEKAAEAPLKAADKHDESIKDEKDEPKASAKVAEAIEKMEEPKAKLVELVKSGKVSAAITPNTETKKSEIVFNFDKEKGGKQADADEANKLLTEALKAVDELRQKVIPDDEEAAHQAVVDNYAIKSAQLNLIRSVYQPEPSESVKAMDRIRAKKLGMINDDVLGKDGKPVQTLDNTTQTDYKAKLTSATLARLTKEYGGQ